MSDLSEWRELLGGVLSVGRRFDSYEETQLCFLFDQLVDQEIEKYYLSKKERRLYKRICLIKLAIFPFQLFLTFIFLNKQYTLDCLKCFDLYVKFLFSRITLDTLKKELLKV